VSHDEQTARLILDALGLTGAELSPLGLGLSSSAWRVSPSQQDVSGRDLALRIALDSADPASTYRSEHLIMARLAAVGASSPTPVRGSWDLEGWPGPPFSLTTLVAGVPMPSPIGDPIDSGRIVQIADFLRALHALPVVGFGPVVPVPGPEEGDQALRGMATDRLAGLRTWMDGAPLWPFDNSRLEEHPALRDRAELRQSVAEIGARIEAANGEGAACLVHSDVHEENILDDRGRLSFIDFGEAFIGAIDWEFATLAYFVGWPAADQIMGAYCRPAEAASRVAALAVSFGLYRWWQDRQRGVDDELHDEAFIRSALDRVPVR